MGFGIGAAAAAAAKGKTGTKKGGFFNSDGSLRKSGGSFGGLLQAVAASRKGSVPAGAAAAFSGNQLTSIKNSRAGQVPGFIQKRRQTPNVQAASRGRVKRNAPAGAGLGGIAGAAAGKLFPGGRSR